MKAEKYSQTLREGRATVDGSTPIRIVVTQEVNFLGIWITGPTGTVLRRRVPYYGDTGPGYAQIFEAVDIATRGIIVSPDDAAIVNDPDGDL